MLQRKRSLFSQLKGVILVLLIFLRYNILVHLPSSSLQGVALFLVATKRSNVLKDRQHIAAAQSLLQLLALLIYNTQHLLV